MNYTVKGFDNGKWRRTMKAEWCSKLLCGPRVSSTTTGKSHLLKGSYSYLARMDFMTYWKSIQKSADRKCSIFDIWEKIDRKMQWFSRFSKLRRAGLANVTPQHGNGLLSIPDYLPDLGKIKMLRIELDFCEKSWFFVQKTTIFGFFTAKAPKSC